jgi:hypothetical protein
MAVRTGLLGIEPDGPVELGNCLVKFLPVDPSGAAGAAGASLLGIELDAKTARTNAEDCDEEKCHQRSPAQADAAPLPPGTLVRLFSHLGVP